MQSSSPSQSPPSSSPSPSSSPQQHQQRPRSSNNAPPPSPPASCTACVGVTVYSRAHHDAGKPPSCLGISRRRKQPSDIEAAAAEPTLLPPDVAPGGDFKFLCVGYAVCRDGANSKNKAEQQGRGRPGAGGPAISGRSNDLDGDDDVELPACLGLQIIRAAAATPAAMPMRGTATGMASDSSSSSEKQQQPQQQQPRRAPLARRSNANTSPAPELPSLLDALDKWEKSARRVAVRMGSNLLSIFGGRE